MKSMTAILVLLAAGCSAPPPDLSPITAELTALRGELEQLKKAEQSTFDTAQAMEDLARELRRLRDLPTPSAVPPAAQPVPAPAGIPIAPTGSLSGGVGGTQNGVNDHYWVLSKVHVGNEERIVLALYQAQPGSRAIRLAAVRMLNADLQMIEFSNDRPSVKQVLDGLKK